MTLIHNTIQFFRLNPEYLIKCKRCKTKQEKALHWDYQYCVECGEKLYDERP